MNRRQFLKYSIYTTLMSGGVSGLGLAAPRLASAATGSAYGRTLVNVMLLGGADLRFLLVPEPGNAYADEFWDARKSLYQNNPTNTALYPDYATVWSQLYVPATAGAITFGIHKNAAWLKAEFDLGNVAIVSNTLGSNNRRHDHSQLIVDTGDPLASQYVFDREGWGGRLVYAAGAESNAVAVTNSVSIFCNGIEASNRNAHVVHARNTRPFGLSPGDADPVSESSVMARALASYYAQKRVEATAMPDGWSHRKFLQHEEAARTFGDTFNARLSAVAPVQPASLQGLYTAGSGNTLNSAYFGLQCGNVYDSLLGADLFRMRVLSMDYGGWDTHRGQKDDFEANIEDLFGVGKGLDTLTQELDLLPGAPLDDLAFTFNTDFGRQLRANGDHGTDHGGGNYLIAIGRTVTGGVYGEMFPTSEIQGSAGETRFDQDGSDIEGRTSLERVLSAACDWVEPDTGSVVFPNAATSILESGVNLDGLFGSGS